MKTTIACKAVIYKFDQLDRTYHADAFLQYTPNTEIVPGDHIRRQGFPSAHLDQVRLKI